MIEKGNPSLEMVQSDFRLFTPVSPYSSLCTALIVLLPLYHGAYPAPLSRYPVTSEDSLCESL